MRGAFWGLVALGAVIGFGLGAAFVLYETAVRATLATDQPGDIRDGVLVDGGVAALLGALAGMAAGIGGGFWPPGPVGRESDATADAGQP